MAGENKKSMDPAVLAAIITVVGGIVVALITTFANRQASLPPTPTPPPTWTSVPTATITDSPVPTSTVQAGEPTSTPAPDTPTPAPSATPPPPALGDDWANGCISSLWQPYPSSASATVMNNNCLQEPVLNFFSADKGTLYLQYNRAQKGPVENYGLFAPLPESGSVTVTVYVNELTNVDLWLGIFPKADINSQGLLLTIPSGNGKKRVIVEKDPITYNTLQGTQNLDQGGGFNITLSFDALSAKAVVNPNIFVPNSLSVPSSQKWLFIGYKGLAGAYRINAYLFNFQLKQ